MFKYVYLFILTITFFSCKEEPEERICDVVGQGSVLINYCELTESFSDTPLLERIITISRTHVTGALDSISLKISFKDGDGDLGDGKADSFMHHFNLCQPGEFDTAAISLILAKDSRNNCFFPYHIPLLTRKNVPLSGELNLILSPVCCIYPDNTACHSSTQYPSDTIIFKIKIKDRAGHFSNELETPPIYINCNF